MSKILFVDDEPQALKYFDKALSKDFAVLTAGSVSAAIAILEEQHEDIAVVITDQRMPKQKGIELLQYTHQHHPQIVRMLTTAFCEIDNAIDAINSVEVFRYISKPWDLDDLAEVLNQGLQRYLANQNIEVKAGNSEELILQELHEDCRSWKEYAGYAYGDVNIYRSGIEALANKYYRKLKESVKPELEEQITLKIDRTIDDHFLNGEVLSSIAAQQDKGFGEALTPVKKNLH